MKSNKIVTIGLSGGIALLLSAMVIGPRNQDESQKRYQLAQKQLANAKNETTPTPVKTEYPWANPPRTAKNPNIISVMPNGTPNGVGRGNSQSQTTPSQPQQTTTGSQKQNDEPSAANASSASTSSSTEASSSSSTSASDNSSTSSSVSTSKTKDQDKQEEHNQGDQDNANAKAVKSN